jgi:hypothetical protein
MMSPNDGHPQEDRANGAQAVEADDPAGRHRFIALVLALFIPGAGHISSGRVASGVIWMAVSFAAYAHRLWYGLAIHALCVVATARIGRVHPPAAARPSS